MINEVLWRLIPLPLGFLLDLLLGDPVFLYHPVRLIGNLISLTEKLLRSLFSISPRKERLAGVFLVIIVCVLSMGVPCMLLWFCYRISLGLGIAAETFLCYRLLAVKSLKQESMKVYHQLKKNNLNEARYAVSMIVGRDTEKLTDLGVTKAAVETVAENTSDGVIAPLLYMALGGISLIFFYKAVNTMDSMIGYKNERYLNFGRCAAKLDDTVNFIPARISAWLMIAAAFPLGLDWQSGKRIYQRDKYLHASPNSAHPEAVMAGVLNIQLAGEACYFGKPIKKPVIGDSGREIEYEDIKKANQLMYGSAALGALLFTGVRFVLLFVFRFKI